MKGGDAGVMAFSLSFSPLLHFTALTIGMSRAELAAAAGPRRLRGTCGPGQQNSAGGDPATAPSPGGLLSWAEAASLQRRWARLSPWCLWLQLPQKLCARAKSPFPSLKLLFTSWILLPFSKGNAQSDLANQLDQENTLEKLELSIHKLHFCWIYTELGKIQVSDWFIPDPNT